MKRKLAVAAVTAVALIGGGSVAAVASDGAGGSAAASARADDRDDRDGTKDDDRDSGRDDDRSDDRDDDRDESRAAQSAGTTASEAAEAALKAAPGTVTSIELDHEKRGPVWEVEVAEGGTSHEIRLDADTNKVLSDRTERDDETVPDSKLSAADVARTAAERGTVTSVELDDDAGKPTWEVETAGKGDKGGKDGETELTVDGRSGKITQSGTDHEDADDRDDDGARDGDGDRDDDHDAEDRGGDD